jgi:hypothetical protein
MVITTAEAMMVVDQMNQHQLLHGDQETNNLN